MESSPATYKAWGKLNGGGTTLRIHLLFDHMFDVAACFGALSNCMAIRRAMELAAQSDLADADISRLATLVFLHDIGKANSGVQIDYSAAGEDRRKSSQQRAEHAVSTIGIDVAPLRLTTFEMAFNVPAPRPMQTAGSDSSLGPLVILESETGSGKTEAALWRFIRLFQEGAVDSLFFALPTRVAATQLYERIREVVARLWPADAPVVVRALPGYEAADGQAKISLPDFKVLWPDKPDDKLADQRWVAEAPKRFLAATIAVGTIDQALLGVLRVRHAHLRHALLSRSLLVVDEVHASDAYMTVLLEQLLKAHLQIGGQAMLLSATLGAVARTKYLNIGHPESPQSIPPLNVASKLAYPAISHCAPAGARLEGVTGNSSHKTVHWKTLDAMDDPNRVAALAIEAAAATLLAVEAQAGAQSPWLFRVDGISALHHSRFSRQDRPLLDTAVEDQLGKHRAGVSGRIIIGTQTLEQSLDIDADLLITDLCPMDVLLQRVGRLHRHKRPEAERPDGFRFARAWALTPAGHDLAPMLERARNGLGRLRDGGGIYPDLRILEATRQLIDAQASRSIPADNRVLVEHATHPEALQAVETSLGDEWRKIGQCIEGDTGARRSLARLHAILHDKPFSDTSFPDSCPKIATRLGAADRLIEFTPPQLGPFGQAVNQIALRFHQMQAGLSPDAQPSDIAALPGRAGFEFALGTARYRYSRLGLERLKADDLPLATSGDPP